jgi:hypothetical protein
METAPSLRRERSRRDPVTEDDQIVMYLRSVRLYLKVRKDQRSRVLEEIESHMIDGAAAYVESGATRSEAIKRVIEELGPPEAAADAFTEERRPVRRVTGPMRWLPMLVPMIALALSVVLGLWSLTWVSGGLTVGERDAQWTYVRHGLIAAILSCAIYLIIERADADRAWRWAAWFSTAAALVILATW